MFGDSGRLLFGEWPDGDLDDADSHGAVAELGELVVAVEGGAGAEPAPGCPPGGRVVDGDVAVQVAGRPSPVFVVGAADAGLENDPAGPVAA